MKRSRKIEETMRTNRFLHVDPEILHMIDLVGENIHAVIITLSLMFKKLRRDIEDMKTAKPDF